MEYNKLTKAELIELLEKSVDLDKYNRLQRAIEANKKSIEERDIKIKALEEQIAFEQKTSREAIKAQMQHSEKHIKEFESQANDYVSKMQAQAKEMKNHLDYTSNMLSKEYQLTQLILQKRKVENEIFEDFVTLFHDSIFDNKEEENTQESET
jgi:hypothetical protein